uniref:Ca2+ sensor ef-hand superfamily n=1 Tax=Panagrellus redivivus TaxID=6233 RepID=A0A7E4VWG1_PANRE
MGLKNTKLDLPEDADDICKTTGFNHGQLARLYRRFKHLSDGETYLTRDQLKNLRAVSDNPLGDRILEAFFFDDPECQETKKMTFNQFAHVLARFRPGNSGPANEINSKENKLKFAFSMYDITNDGYISYDEFIYVLKLVLGDHEQIETIAERSIAEADVTKNGRLSFDEFSQAMEHVAVDQKMSMRFKN